MLKLLPIMLTLLFTFSARAEDSQAKAYATPNLLTDIAKAIQGTDEQSAAVVGQLVNQTISQVIKEVVGRAYQSLMQKQSNGFLKYLSPELADQYQTLEAQDALRLLYSADSAPGYQDQGILAALPITLDKDGQPAAKVVLYYIMAKSETDIITYTIKVDVPFEEGAKAVGGSLNDLLSTLTAIDVSSGKISFWEKSVGLPEFLRAKSKAAPVEEGAKSKSGADEGSVVPEKVRHLNSQPQSSPEQDASDRELQEKARIRRLIEEGKFI